MGRVSLDLAWAMVSQPLLLSCRVTSDGGEPASSVHAAQLLTGRSALVSHHICVTMQDARMSIICWSTWATRSETTPSCCRQAFLNASTRRGAEFTVTLTLGEFCRGRPTNQALYRSRASRASCVAGTGDHGRSLVNTSRNYAGGLP